MALSGWQTGPQLRGGKGNSRALGRGASELTAGADGAKGAEPPSRVENAAPSQGADVPQRGRPLRPL